LFSSAEADINSLLEPFGRFGVDLGLDRMLALLQAMGNPQRQVPILHVAGTNGKGSVCAYLSSVLTRAGYRVGRYTSPHLVSWCERITINEQPIAAAELLRCLQQVVACIAPKQPFPTQFEVFTAAAWLYFAEAQVDLAVIEVGLGGRLDATNVVDTPLVSVITSLSREHWQRLGPTLADIAGEKAGILKPGCPAVIGPLPPEAEGVVKARLNALQCDAVWPQPAQPVGPGKARYGTPPDALDYCLPFSGEHQLVNSALAIATLHELRRQGWIIADQAIAEGIAQARWPGRLQGVTWHSPQGRAVPLLIDGAHNPAAAVMLRRYVDTQLAPITQAVTETDKGAGSVAWLIGMLSTKDHRDVLAALLRPGDSLHLVPVPGHASVDPEELGQLASELCPGLVTCQTHGALREGLTAMASISAPVKVLCGSLYLVGEFFGTEPFSSSHKPQK
jgi:dihydrofolate synthase/folylpolyglutamate synthase